MSEEIKTGQTEETPTGEVKQPEVMPTSQEPSTEVTGELPAEASERTKQEFEKLKEHNKKLADENTALKGGQNRPPSLLESYVLHNAPQPQPQAAFTPPLSQTQVAENRGVIDEQGFLNQDVLEDRLRKADEAEARANQAQRQAQEALERVGRFEIDSQTRALYKKYPQLDPSEATFDPEAYELVKKELLDQLVSGKRQNAVEAADNMSKYFSKPEVTPQQQQVITQRQQATTPPGSGNTSLSNADFESLRRKSMTSEEAMDERIRRAGI